MSMPPTGRRTRSGLSPAALDAADWLEQLERLVHLARRHGPYASHVRNGRERATVDGVHLVHDHGPIVLTVLPLEIRLAHESVMRAEGDEAGHPTRGPIERQLPAVLHQQGLRQLSLLDDLTRDEMLTLVQILLDVSTAHDPGDDLVTLLWRAGLAHVRVRSAASAPLQDAEPGHSPSAPVRVQAADLVDDRPFDQVLSGDSFSRHQEPPPPSSDITSRTTFPAVFGDPFAIDGAPTGPAPATSAPTAGEPAPADTHFDDWLIPSEDATAGALWQQLVFDEDRHAADFQERWKVETSPTHATQVRAFVDEVRAADPSEDMRDAVLTSLVSWVANAVQHCEWSEARQALDAVRTLDPDGSRTEAPLAQSLAGLDRDVVAERLDAATQEEQARFFALAVAIGRPILDLLIHVLAQAGRARLRAAATTALAYTCGDQPDALRPYLNDSRWHVVRNVVFALGQIGGPAVMPMLVSASRHLDTRVRRAVVQALGQVPAPQRTPLLVQQLDSSDVPLLQHALQLMTREPDARAASALIDRISAPDFESLSPERKLALLQTLADVADDQAVPALEQLLHRGGWFARRSPERTAAARTLARIGSPLAMAALQNGLAARADAVRLACADALDQPRTAP